MFDAVHSSEAKQLKSAFEGAQLKLMVYGERMMLNHVELEAGACVTMHNHPNETDRLLRERSRRAGSRGRETGLPGRIGLDHPGRGQP